MKCAVCNENVESVWSWQPFGPDDPPGSFTLPSFHYRGFPVIKVCASCKEEIQRGCAPEFTYLDQRYIMGTDGPHAVPNYVSDALAWLEAQPLMDPASVDIKQEIVKAIADTYCMMESTYYLLYENLDLFQNESWADEVRATFDRAKDEIWCAMSDELCEMIRRRLTK